MLSMLWKVGLDATAFLRGMSKVKEKGEKAFDGMANALTKKATKAALIWFAIDSLKKLYTAIKDNVQNIKDLSDNMGLTTDEVQRLGIAADKSAVQMSTVEGALRRIDDLRASAQSGDKSAVSIFSNLGINPAQGTSLEILRKAVDQSGKGAKQLTAFYDLVGQKANQIKSVVVELGKLGPIKLVEESDIKMIDDMSTSLKELSREALTVATEKAAPFFGMVSRIIKRGREIDSQGKSFALSRAILEESYGTGPVSGVDGSALPLPQKKPKTDPSLLSSVPLALQSDALSRIGLFVGGRGDASNQLVTIGNYQLSELRAIRAELQHGNR